jgi:hypothetical protein
MNDLGRYATFEFREPSEFIGEWLERTDCLTIRVPVERRAPPVPSKLGAFADAFLALSAVAAIFSIPVLIMFVTVR